MIGFNLGRCSRIPAYRRPRQLCVFEVDAQLNTTDGALNNFEIDPVVWRQLPNKAILVLNVAFTIPTTRLPLPIQIEVQGALNTRDIPFVDEANAPVVGTFFTGGATQVEVYLNKEANIFRLQGVQ